MAEETILRRELPHSIEVSRNYKGEYAYVLKRYYEDGAEKAAVDTLASIDADLRDRFIPKGE